MCFVACFSHDLHGPFYGANSRVVQERLGHSDIGITANIYRHVAPTMQRQAADAFSAAMEQAATMNEGQR